MAPEQATPVFVYSASGEEESLTGACLSQCRDLPDCAAVVVAYTKGTCQGVASLHATQFRADNDVVYFNKVCLKLPENCSKRWWSLESTLGYYLNSEDTHTKVLLNTTVQQCYDAVFSTNEKLYRSAQWLDPKSPLDTFALSHTTVGNCILNIENKFTEPESYRVSNYYTFYIENQCGHDYPKKIDRCSYEEYYNQTIKHVDLTIRNYTKTECKLACEAEKRFVCRGFTWTATSSRGLCDLHSEDLVSTGSWLLRRVTGATYYRRVICLNISVECEGSHLVVTYKPRTVFRGRMYVPGRGEHCGARALTPTSPVRLALPMYGDCDVNFAYAITKGPNGNVNRTMAYVMLMIQNNPIIQTAGDRWVRVGCSPGAGARGYAKVDATVAVQDSGRPSLASEASVAEGANQGASAVFDRNTAPLRMYVVRAHGDTLGGAGATAVSLGELLELWIDTIEESEIEAYHLVASSRLGDSSVLLLDSRGCPTGQVDFPSFTRTRLGGTQRLSAKFKAFRFPTSHVVRFAIMVRFCEEKCQPIVCGSMEQLRNARNINVTYEVPNAKIAESHNFHVAWASQVVAQGGRADCAGGEGRVPLELEMVVGSRDILSADTLVRADHRSSLPEETPSHANESAMVCIHELLLVALVLIWLAVQILLLLGCCILVKRYRNLAEMNMHKDYQSFDNVGFDTVSTHRRVHWPDQNIDIIHAT
ncbi:jg21206 [Pararge aegeria aegeria]|uniref:Jg21206 protein n=1 Tax=Pararge aegeria aegeria TaxID=348720 RepID=A0A8S4RC61_9NEOP|nr:jg21206 [Pararge aegeria aegeria]